MEAFLIPAGTTIEVYATTLHYAPCNVAASGFKCVVVLPKGTNTDITLEEKHTPEDDLLFARNKWLLSHPDANIAGSPPAVVAVTPADDADETRRLLQLVQCLFGR